jgi:hypothetical protein
MEAAMQADKIPADVMAEARALLMKLHGATELGQRANWLAEALMARDTATRKECVEIAREAQRMRERLFAENEASINAHRAMQAMEIADAIEATITGGGDERR